jgi:hypothetical protein
MYDNPNYAATRLNNTIVMLKRKPVLVLCVDMHLRALVTYDVKNHTRAFLVSCKELNVTNLELGFLNKGKHCQYMARRTLRRDWRQGLRPNNVHSTQGETAMSDIVAVLKHRYPSFKVAVGKVEQGKVVSCAWCPDFAIIKGGLVKWRYEVVGKYDKGGITLGNKYKFLTSQLIGATDGCCKVL